MRWDRLFDDLEGQLEQELAAEELDERAEEERLRIGRLSMRDRLLAIHERCGGEAVRLVLGNGEAVSVRTTTFGRDWVAAEMLDGRHRRTQCVIPLDAVSALLPTRSQLDASLTPLAHRDGADTLAARLTLPFVLRDLCRRRAPLDLRALTGDSHGTIDRVGRDHIDLAVHEAGTARRAATVQQYRIVPLGQLLLVRV
ncbi:MAG: hypothetical protein JWM50_1978 [Microbacteriaceae bacterium]|jgi:hypothetical protein|nr:hypothetical protein [Microbacteriaceae bacterium]